MKLEESARTCLVNYINKLNALRNREKPGLEFFVLLVYISVCVQRAYFEFLDGDMDGDETVANIIETVTAAQRTKTTGLSFWGGEREALDVTIEMLERLGIDGP